MAHKGDFKKGHIPWNKGIKMPEISGERNHNWKGDNINYSGIHSWLYRCCPKNRICTICKETKKTDWALIKGEKYERVLSNFMELCKKCHNKYNGIGELRGEHHPLSKLNSKKVINIRKIFDNGALTNREIAKKFKIEASTVGQIVKGKTWKHLLTT